MKLPVINYISKEEYCGAENIYKIIDAEISYTYAYFELNSIKYYLAYSSCEPVKAEIFFIEEKNYLLIGVDFKVVVISTVSGTILLSLGLYSFFKGFRNNNDLSFTILSELEDIIINKNGLSISQIVSHDLEF